MATLRIDNEVDELLEKIRAIYILKGIKKTKKDIIKELIKKEANEIQELENNRIDDDYKDDYAGKMLSKPLNYGIQDTSTTVDEYVYGK